MKNRLISLLALVLALAAGCTRDETADIHSAGSGETWITLDFGNDSYERVTVNTRAVLDETAESRVMNLYVFIFDGGGNRIYGHYFDYGTLSTDEQTVKAAQTECWYVANAVAGKGDFTHGRIRARVPLLDGGGEIHIIANIDADMVNISPEQLNFIHTKSDLLELTASLNQLITSRNGYFPMSGSKGGIAIAKTGITSDDSTSVKVPLYRLDARVEVNIKIDKGSSTSTDIEYDADGDGTTSTAVRTQKITGFRPESWQVVNLPRGCFLSERKKSSAADKDSFDAPTGYFDSEEVNFEQISDESSGFAFYMLENRPNGKKPAGNFNGRDLRCKDASGAYDNSNGMWANAPEEGTYLIIKGEVVMDVNVSSEAKEQKLNAAVTYYIHLGDFSAKTGNVDNYDIERNTRYTYNITIKGVDRIQAEVEKGEEKEPAATGHVYIAKESIYTFDAHYGQRAFAFDEAFITPATVTWYVKTPFGREGTPEIVGGVEVPNGLDYDWVHFLVNDHADADNPASPYSKVQKRYSPSAMNVIDFVAYIKDQKRRFDERRKEHPDDPAQWTAGNDFRAETDTSYPDGLQTRYRIWITAFVDEYYYEEDPISGEKSPSLWKRFVNRPNRMMHLLCDTNFSADRESSTTGSVVTIRQRAIQSIFDPDAPITSAWGVETVDEAGDTLWFYDDRETTGSPSSYMGNTDYGNDSESNGLYNSACLWELSDGKSFTTGKRWADFLDFDRENDHELGFLKDDADAHTLRTARYTCMMRNRDNNGDGIIDASELRWYMASVRQLMNLYIGQTGISGDAILYPQSRGALYHSLGDKADADGFYPWRSHIISSTKKSGSLHPAILWAEEGLSTSAYKEPEVWKQSGRYSVRCVRNLGNDPQSETAAQAAVTNPTQHFNPVLTVTGPGIGDNTENVTADGVYRFDLSNMNRKSVRFYTTKELEISDEYSEMARPYLGFETGPLVETDYSYDEMSAMLQSGKSPCPDGYRVPNVRELSLMSEYIPSGWWSGYIYCSNYYSIEPQKHWEATFRHNTLAPQSGTRIRCVRDIR
ncbi:MAG: DUF4906 domain-containing protein [Alistipes sp.]|nr:DUF4906 domain-containing protein [Alistipes sp.]